MKVVSKTPGTDYLMELPKPNSFIGPASKKHYNRLGRILVKSKRLKSEHLPALEIFAENFAQWEWAVREIRTKNRSKPGTGYIQKFASGARNISAEITVKRDAEKAILLCFKQFGLDPKSEKDLNLEPLNQTNLLEALGLTPASKTS